MKPLTQFDHMINPELWRAQQIADLKEILEQLPFDAGQRDSISANLEKLDEGELNSLYLSCGDILERLKTTTEEINRLFLECAGAGEIPESFHQAMAEAARGEVEDLE